MNDKRYCERSGKVCYTKADAGGAVNAAKRHKTSWSKNIPKRYYWCSHCGFYHLTKYRKKISPNRRAVWEE